MTEQLSRGSMPLAVVLLAFGGALTALAGGYWDDAWHTERGRDDFFIAPHIAIYAGITVAGAVLALWALHVARRERPSVILDDKPLALALLSVAVTLASGPIDNAWHGAFGRDAVIWSPPHMLGIAGTLALGAALLSDLARRTEPWARRLTVVAGALVLASAGFASVEYDTDVPQFDVAFYLPVAGFAASIGLVLVRTAGSGRWAATVAGVIYTGFIAAVGLFLVGIGFPAPALPLFAFGAVVVDLADARRWPPLATALAFTVALHIAYVPVRNLLGDGVRFDVADVVAGAALTFVATWLVFGAAAWRHGVTWRATAHALPVIALMTITVLSFPPVAGAHDPGQGEDAGTVALGVRAENKQARLVVDLLPSACGSTRPVAVVARRAGETRREALRQRGCRLSGTVPVPTRGRWFIYAEMRRDGRVIESWLPVVVGREPSSASDARRYAYYPPNRSNGIAKLLGGITLYGSMLALLYATLVLVRKSSSARTGPSVHPTRS